MIARFLRITVAIAPRILGRWLLRDLVPLQSHIQPTQAWITPVVISAYPRQYPQTSMARGKGVIISGALYTARHVLEDEGLIYRMDHTNELTRLIDLGADVGLADYSGSVATGARHNIPSLRSGQVLMAQYRNMSRSRLTGIIIDTSGSNNIVDLAVQPGDSGSPVILPQHKIGIVSQSHSGDHAIVKVVK